MKIIAAAAVICLMCVRLLALDVKEVVVNTPEEAKYLFEHNCACNEIGSNPFTPFTRIADRNMFYTYRFRVRKGCCAFLLLNIGTQFFIEASADNESWQKVCDYEDCETLAGRTLVDLTPFTGESGTVYVRFTDKYKEDGWGALLSSFRLYTSGAAAPVSRIEIGQWECGGRTLPAGVSAETGANAVFTARAELPKGWKGEEIALYIPDTLGTPVSAEINGRPAKIGTTWDRGKYITGGFVCGGENLIALTLAPEKGRAGIAAPARIGLRYTACAAPSAKLLDGVASDPLRTQAPYTYDKMNYIAGNYTNYLYDERYDLLAFNDRAEIHYLHDTARNICALAEEERFTPVVRLELIKRLYRGLKGGLIPTGTDDVLLSFKHDRRPVDIRPLEDTPFLTMVQKMDLMRKICAIGVTCGSSLESFSDTPLKYKNGKWHFSRAWKGAGRRAQASCDYYLGDSDLPPCITFSFDGQGTSSVDLTRLSDNDFWFRPGSWGPEQWTFPNGLQRAADRGLDIARPDFDYIILSGGNGLDQTDVPDQGAGLSLLIMWDKTPERIRSEQEPGGRWGSTVGGFHLVFGAECRKVNIRILPFMDYPNDQKAVIALAENLKKTGKFGMGFYNPYASTFGSGIGADGFAAAAYIFDKYGLPDEAEEAKGLAEGALATAVKYDQMESGSNHLYHLIKACLYLHLMGDTRFDAWGEKWADRIVKAQKEDGSWTWLNWQVRNMSGLISAWELTGNEKYLDSLRKGMDTLTYDADGGLLWNGTPSGDDFHGAGSFNVFGWAGDTEKAQKAVESGKKGIDDGAFFHCSDLNPYMLGLSAKGLGLASTDKKLILGLEDSAVYDRDRAFVTRKPTCNTYNRYHPLAKDIDFPLDF